MARACLIALLFVMAAANRGAATESADSTSRAQTVTDTVLFQPPHPEFLKQEVIDTVDHEAHLTQKPTVALFKSMFVPGWGQIGNHKYIKASVIIGLQSWFIASAVHYGRQASDYRRQWLAETDLARRRELYSQFDERRDKRNKFIWFAGLTTFVSMFDAYVDAHLSGKPREPKVKTLSVRLGPDPGGGGRVELALRF